MNNIKLIQKLNEAELRNNVPENASWHTEFAHSAYIFIGGLNYEMNEGDVAIVFSQYGEIVDVHLKRDKKTGKSQGYAFLAYENQKSTILAVDNLNGIELCGRMIRVSHVTKYKVPKEYTEIKQGEEEEDILEDKLYRPSGPDGKGWGEFRELNESDIKRLEEETIANERPTIQNKTANKMFILDEDERWEKMLMEKLNTDTDKKKLKDKKHKKKKHKKDKKSKGIKKNKKNI